VVVFDVRPSAALEQIVSKWLYEVISTLFAEKKVMLLYFDENALKGILDLFNRIGVGIEDQIFVLF